MKLPTCTICTICFVVLQSTSRSQPWVLNLKKAPDLSWLMSRDYQDWPVTSLVVSRSSSLLNIWIAYLLVLNKHVQIIPQGFDIRHCQFLFSILRIEKATVEFLRTRFIKLSIGGLYGLWTREPTGLSPVFLAGQQKWSILLDELIRKGMIPSRLPNEFSMKSPIWIRKIKIIRQIKTRKFEKRWHIWCPLYIVNSIWVYEGARLCKEGVRYVIFAPFGKIEK